MHACNRTCLSVQWRAKRYPKAFYGGHTPIGVIPTENEPRPATSSRLLYPQSTLRSVKALRDKEEYPLRLLKSRCDPGFFSAQRSLLVGKVRKVPLVQMLFSAGFLRFGRQCSPPWDPNFSKSIPSPQVEKSLKGDLALRIPLRVI